MQGRIIGCSLGHREANRLKKTLKKVSKLLKFIKYLPVTNNNCQNFVFQLKSKSQNLKFNLNIKVLNFDLKFQVF